MKRRTFILSGSAALLGSIGLDGFWLERFYFEVNEFFIGSNNQDRKVIKILQVSDLHMRTMGDLYRRIAKKINRISPEVLCITGDAVESSQYLPYLQEFLQLIDPGIKKLAVMGNWEHWGKIGRQQLTDFYDNNQCELLINRSVQLKTKGKTLSFTGIDSYVGGKANHLKALEHYQPGDWHIMLSHCPVYTDIMRGKADIEVPVDLILSGHTHGGQINLFGFVPFLPRGSGRYIRGWYEDEQYPMYVSKGVGTTILPIRLGSRAEITVFNFPA